MCLFVSPAFAEGEREEWIDLYAQHLNTITEDGKDSGIRFRMLLVDLGFDGVPELVYGVHVPDTGETRLQVLTISNGKVIPAEGETINGAFPLEEISVVLYKTGDSYQWSLITNGPETPNGRWQVRYTVLKMNGTRVSYSNRFTKRTSTNSRAFFHYGKQIGELDYDKLFSEYRSKMTVSGYPPITELGSADKVPTRETLLSRYDNLVERYIEYTKPKKYKLMVQYPTLKLNKKTRTKFVITRSYAHAVQKSVRWTSSDPSIVTISSKGVIKAVGYGKATVTATLPGGHSMEKEIKVPRPKVKKVSIQSDTKTMKKGEVQRLFAKITPLGARATVKWGSSKPSVARVDEQSGLVTAVARGKAVIVARIGDKVMKRITITVQDGTLADTVQLVDPGRELKVGERVAIASEVQPENATNAVLSWRSSKPSVATVSESGYVTAISAGSTTITASVLGGAKATVTITVHSGEASEAARVQDGIYKISLRGQSKAALAFRRNGTIYLAQDQDTLSQRFMIKSTADGTIEIYSLLMPDAAMAMVESDGGKQWLALSQKAEPAMRIFTAESLGNGSYQFRVAAQPERSFGASKAAIDANVVPVEYKANAQLQQFVLTRLGDLPSSSPTSTDWAQAMRTFVEKYAETLSTSTHMQLCDLDFNGVPELVVYTSDRVADSSSSRTSRVALVYSPDQPNVAPAIFQYETGQNADYGEARPQLRLVAESDGTRRWILTDGTDTNNTGCSRYVVVRYNQGVIELTSSLVRAWGPSSNTSSGLASERYYQDDKECTKYVYEQALDAQLKGWEWPKDQTEFVLCSAQTLEDILLALDRAIASRRWGSQ
ncbi:Ig-like domain-containing protein [Eubacteriales bacterium OttesenSCG-928-N13]|nr:Ig-like domain-containing protein [Eubacteriales bacterium OttesenSCG-928-N13]